MAHPVVHFEVLGKDTDALESFYKELFGWQTEKVPAEDFDYRMVQAGGEGGIGGGIGAAPDSGPGHVTFYVQSDDIRADLDKAKSLGGDAVMGPQDLPGGGAIGLFTDPEGHVIGLFRPPSGG
jgi:predicted enzyme related to lactoylglutathione lyase